MRRPGVGGRPGAVRLGMLGMGIAVIAHAAPIGQGEPLAAPTPAATGGSAIGRNLDSADGAAAATSEGRGEPVPRHSLVDAVGRAAKPPGHVAMMSSRAVPVEENPRVDVEDALYSVLRATAAAVPWLHVEPPTTGQRAVRGTDALAAIEPAVRFDDAQGARGASSRGFSQGGGESGEREAVPSWTRELVRFIRELLANPLAWMVVLLALMAATVVSLVRSRGK